MRLWLRASTPTFPSRHYGSVMVCLLLCKGTSQGKLSFGKPPSLGLEPFQNTPIIVPRFVRRCSQGAGQGAVVISHAIWCLCWCNMSRLLLLKILLLKRNDSPFENTPCSSNICIRTIDLLEGVSFQNAYFGLCCSPFSKGSNPWLLLSPLHKNNFLWV